jgi:hypothetical protein
MLLCVKLKTILEAFDLQNQLCYHMQLNFKSVFFIQSISLFAGSDTGRGNGAVWGHGPRS